MDSLLTVILSNAVAAILLAVVALVVGRVFRRPALTHGLWLLVLLKLFTPPLVRIPVSWPGDEAKVVEEVVAPTATEEVVVRVDLTEEAIDLDAEAPQAGPQDSPESAQEPLPETAETVVSKAPQGPLPDWRTWLVVFWLMGSIAWLTLALSRIRKLRLLLRFGKPAPSWLLAEVNELAARVGLKQVPTVLLVPGKLSPMIWSLCGSPRLLLPVELLDALTPEKRATLLIHELAHLHRRDHWVRWLEIVASALYWWHPVVWLARRELREAEEQCCDAWVVWTLPGTGRVYADALVSCIDFLSDAPAPLPLGASGLGHIVDLKRRLKMILKGTTPRRLTRGGVAVLLGLGLLLLPLLPSMAQDRKEPPPERKLDPKEVEEARANLDKLKQELMEQMKKVKAAEDKLRDAAEKLGRIEGKGGEGKVRILIIRDGENADILKKHVEFERRIERGPGNPPNPPNPRDARFPQDPRGTDRPHQPATPRAGGEDRRFQDLERKLDNVLRELEEMRRNMRGGRPGGPQGGPEERGPGTFRPMGQGGQNVRPMEKERTGPRPPEERRPEEENQSQD